VTRDPIEHECVICGELIAGAHYPLDPIGWACADCFHQLPDDEREWRLAAAEREPKEPQ
jgi:hypothetical protein